MLIVVCGMHRSGSTLVWQITRMLLDGNPALRNPRGLSTAEFPHAASDPDDLLMAKVHFRTAMNKEDFPAEGARYLYTFRDPRDVVASLYRKGRYRPESPHRGARKARLTTRRELRGDIFWRAKPDVWIRRYEDFKDDVPGLIRDLAGYLGIPVEESRISEIAAQVDIEAQAQRASAAKKHGVSDDLRITSNHITDGRAGAWRDTLTQEELGAIEGESALWLVEHGYTVESPTGKRKLAPRTTPAERAALAKSARQERADQAIAEARSAGRAVRMWVAAAALLAIASIAAVPAFPLAGIALGLGAAASATWGAYRLGQRRVPLRRVVRVMLTRRPRPAGQK